MTLCNNQINVLLDSIINARKGSVSLYPNVFVVWSPERSQMWSKPPKGPLVCTQWRFYLLDIGHVLNFPVILPGFYTIFAGSQTVDVLNIVCWPTSTTYVADMGGVIDNFQIERDEGMVIVDSECYFPDALQSLCVKCKMLCTVQTQWSFTVTRTSPSWRGSCFAPSITTWPTATSLSSRTGQFDQLSLAGRGTSMLTIQMIWRGFSELYMSSNRCSSIYHSHICEVQDNAAIL